MNSFMAQSTIEGTRRSPDSPDSPRLAHRWVDEGLSANGRAWQAGVRFTCSRCGLEKRTDHGVPQHVNDAQKRPIYFRNRKRVTTGEPPCIGGVR
jgi:hypothetical protein